MKFDSSIHTHGGMLYDTTNTNHILYELVMLPNGLKPSIARPSLMFLASFANSSQFLSKSFHASPSAGWLSSLSTGCHFNMCHCPSFAIFDERNILFSLETSKNTSIPYEKRTSCCLHLSILNPLHNIVGTHHVPLDPCKTIHNYSYKHG